MGEIDRLSPIVPSHLKPEALPRVGREAPRNPHRPPSEEPETESEAQPLNSEEPESDLGFDGLDIAV